MKLIMKRLFVLIALSLVLHSQAFAPSWNRFSEQSSTTIFMSDEVVEDFTPPKPSVRCPNCDKCDGSGRILGGIPLILPWWPIKPYRPCPNFIANGGQYTRIGQPLDEIAFGRGGKIEDDDDF